MTTNEQSKFITSLRKSNPSFKELYDLSLTIRYASMDRENDDFFRVSNELINMFGKNKCEVNNDLRELGQYFNLTTEADYKEKIYTIPFFLGNTPYNNATTCIISAYTINFKFFTLRRDIFDPYFHFVILGNPIPDDFYNYNN